jgi:hypothetical protein
MSRRLQRHPVLHHQDRDASFAKPEQQVLGPDVVVPQPVASATLNSRPD